MLCMKHVTHMHRLTPAHEIECIVKVSALLTIYVQGIEYVKFLLMSGRVQATEIILSPSVGEIGPFPK